MNCKTNMTANLARSLAYGQDRGKGGECFLYQALDPTLTPQQQAEDWTAMSNGYKFDACHLIISFSPKDTERIRKISDTAERIRYERQILSAFFRELAARGNDISKTAYAVFHHGNTQCEHFHAYVLMTDLEGKRWDNSFLKKNASRAAAKVSMDFGLEGSPKAMQREAAHQQRLGKRKRTQQEVDSNNHKRKYTTSVDKQGHIHRDRGTTSDQSVINERLRRQRSVQEAEKRKRQYKYLIEQATIHISPQLLLSQLQTQGITLFADPYLGVAMSATDEDDREHRYALQADLGVDISLFPHVILEYLPIGYVHEADRRKAEEKVAKEVKEKIALSEAKNTIQNSPSLHNVKSVLSVHDGGKDENREHEVGGNRHSVDDPDKEWKQRNGMSY